MFVNYSKLAKELIKEMKEDPELLRTVIDIEDAEKEIRAKFVEICLEDLIKLKRLEVLERANELDYVEEMRAEVGKRINKEVKSTVKKILEM